jgi:serine/threonine protein kinase
VPTERFGPYVVYEELGVGGMATVHRAELQGVEGFRKQIALKRLHPYLAATPEIVQSFVREAQLASKLHHANIAQTFELGKAEGTYFISMEYVPGPTLTQVMRQCQIAAGAIPISVTLGILTQLCEALDYAHTRTDDEGRPLGIIHRDVSPSNIVISNTGIVKLLDFGIAKVTGKQETDTPVGIVIKGKFDYIAPEYLGGQLDLRADLFALGVIAHEMLTGRKLFAGEDDFETSTMVLEMPIQPPSRWSSSVPHELDHIVLTALQRNPDLRWHSASAFHQALVGLGAKAIATHQQILDWVRWAYTKKRAENSGELERVIDMLDQPSSVEIQMTPAQLHELAGVPPTREFDEVLNTVPGVGSMSARPANPSLMELASGKVSMRPAPAPGQVTPGAIVLDAKPVVKKRPTGPRSAEQAAVIPVVRGSSDSGVVVVPPELRPKAGVLRYVLIVFFMLVAAGAGVVTTAYLMGLDLPFL